MYIMLEPLEPRNAPGAVPLWAAAAAAGWSPVFVPRYDVAIVGADNDGHPSRYLDLAQRVLPEAETVMNASQMAAAINQACMEKGGKPVDVVAVGVGTSGGTGIVLGRSYLYKDSDATLTLLREAGGNVRSITWLVGRADQKEDLYQEMATQLSHTCDQVVTVSGYTGFMRVVVGPPAHFETTGTLKTWTSE